MITEQQSKMIDYLIQGETKTDIGKLLGVSRQTIHVWSQLKEVKEEKQKRLNDIKKEAKNKIATKVDNCIDVIWLFCLCSLLRARTVCIQSLANRITVYFLGGVTMFQVLSKLQAFSPLPVAANKCVGTPSSMRRNGLSK